MVYRACGLRRSAVNAEAEAGAADSVVVSRRPLRATLLRPIIRAAIEEEEEDAESSAQRRLRNLNEEMGISLGGDSRAEAVLRDLDPQSAILCGLSRSNGEVSSGGNKSNNHSAVSDGALEKPEKTRLKKIFGRRS